MEKRKTGKSFIKNRLLYILVAVLMSVIVIASFFLVFGMEKTHTERDALKLIISELGMLFAEILFVCCCFSERDDTRQWFTFTAISMVLFVLMFLCGIFDVTDGNPEKRNLTFALQTAISACSTVINLLFWSYQCASLPENRAQRYFSWLIYAMVSGYAVILIVNAFSGFLFYVDASGQTVFPGELIDVAVAGAFYAIYLLYILPQRCSRRKKLTLVSFAVFPILGLVLTTLWHLMEIKTNILSSVFFFLLLAAYVVFFGDYTESRALLLRQKAELAEQAKRQTELQTALMLSQIRPHFLYNALTAIRHLCKNDPAAAYTALGGFADYLRGNMEALSSGRSIPFEKELEHIRTYLMLEQMRFGDELRVEYDIRYREFSLPALSVQPIVENAVRHGATLNETGGVIRICAEKTAEGAVITVTDNGPGFDPAAPIADGRSRFGLENVRNSLAINGCGEMRIDSAPGAGTTVTICIREENR